MSKRAAPQSRGKSRSGGGIDTNKRREIGYKGGKRTLDAVSPAGVDQLGQATSFKRDPLVKATPNDRVALGNTLAAACPQGPGGGRTVYASGYQDQHGAPAKGEGRMEGAVDRGKRAILGEPGEQSLRVSDGRMRKRQLASQAHPRGGVLDVYVLARSKRWFPWQIGEAFGITQSAVSLIQHRHRWRSLFYNKEGNPMTEDELRAELDALKKRQGELEAKLAEADKPPSPPFKPEPRERYDPTANFGMPRSAVKAMVAAVPESLMADLRGDALKPNPVTGTSVAQLTPNRPQVEIARVVRGTNIVDPRPDEPPHGLVKGNQWGK